MYRIKIQYYNKQGERLYSVNNQKFWTIKQAHRHAKDRLNDAAYYKLHFPKGYEKYLLKRYTFVSVVCEILFIPVYLLMGIVYLMSFFLDLLHRILDCFKDAWLPFVPNVLSRIFKWNDIAVKRMEYREVD